MYNKFGFFNILRKFFHDKLGLMLYNHYGQVPYGWFIIILHMLNKVLSDVHSVLITVGARGAGATGTGSAWH